MFPVNFKKERAEYFLQCLDSGDPISHDPDERGWTLNEMAQLAGACFFALLTHGPVLKKAAAEMKGEDYEPPDDAEHREAVDELIFNDVHAGIEFIASLTQFVQDGRYDDNYEEFVQCGASQVVEGEIHKQIGPVQGFKHVEE
jgi:hypothetical protein